MVLWGLLLVAGSATAGPYVEPGNLALRSDIQNLADAGVISGTVSTWPLAWGPILHDLSKVRVDELSPAIADAYLRVRSRGVAETHTDIFQFRAAVGATNEPQRIRGFQRSLRGRGEVSAGVSWLGEWLALDLDMQAVSARQDSNEIRADHSAIGVMLGNWSLLASTQERWWGPGWDGNLILSNNARPIPSIVLDRVFTDEFESKWLSWLGPWDLNVMFGQLESQRHVPNARFFGMRFNFRPIRSLEIGLSRTAQWCGDGRPCGFDTFVDLFLGRDNQGDAGVNPDSEPGNQLAGIDLRWAPGFLGHSMAIYGQFTGEDEAGGFPSRWLGQLGGEWNGFLADKWSTRVFAEYSGTACQFHESSKLYNCAYNHAIYQTGYRYRSRSIGHGADNDTKLVSIGMILVDENNTEWRGILRTGTLNDGGNPDSRNSLTPTPQDIASIDISHSRQLRFGVLDIGIGYERVDDVVAAEDLSETRVSLQWRSSY